MNQNMPANFKLENVSYPAEYGGKIVKLANEMAFANFDLDLAEQRLLYYSMSVFNISEFLSDPKVVGALTSNGRHELDLSLITSDLINRHFWSPEIRSVRIPLSHLIKHATGAADSNKGDWKAFDNAVKKLGSKSIFIQERTSENGERRTYNRIPILGQTYYFEEEGEPKEVVISFAQEFLPYLIAFSSYRKIDITWLSKLESKYSPRFLHFFVYAVKKNGTGSFQISVEKLRERLEIEPGQFKRGFYDKVVKRAVSDIEKKIPTIKVKVTALRKESARGRPTTGYQFDITMSADKLNIFHKK